MEQPTEHDDSRDAEGAVEARKLLEQELVRVSNEHRVASGDAWLYTRTAAKLIARLREVAPELVAAVELEIGVRVE